MHLRLAQENLKKLATNESCYRSELYSEQSFGDLPSSSVPDPIQSSVLSQYIAGRMHTPREKAAVPGSRPHRVKARGPLIPLYFRASLSPPERLGWAVQQQYRVPVCDVVSPGRKIHLSRTGSRAALPTVGQGVNLYRLASPSQIKNGNAPNEYTFSFSFVGYREWPREIPAPV